MIKGLVFRPCSTTEEDNERVMRSSKYWADSEFYKKYQEHCCAMELIAESAKIYILNNYKKVEDWSNLDVKIVDNTGNETHYYKYEGNKGWNRRMKAVSQMLKRREENQNPIETLTDVVLDTTDGDFSLTINGRDHLWIDDDSVISIADYIERTLNF
jgi:hypothetical protein